MMLNWPHRSSTLPFALAGFGIAHFENNGPVAMRASRMCPFICVFS